MRERRVGGEWVDDIVHNCVRDCRDVVPAERWVCECKEVGLVG
jgi:hypothetical protein